VSDLPAVTLAAFARMHDVSQACVSGWRRRGYLVLVEGKVDIAASNARLAARPSVHRGGTAKVRPGKSAEAGRGAVEQNGADVPKSGAVSESSSADPANWSRQEALRQREIAQARLAQIEADRAAGLVVPIADVAKAISAEYSIVRTGLLGMTSKLAHRLAAATTPEACGALVDTEVRAALEALTQDAPK
jgi:hypothetical protein